MPIAFKKNGALNYRALTRDEASLIANFLDAQVERFLKERAAAQALDLLEPNEAKRGKQALYAQHAYKAFRQVLLNLIQTMRLTGLVNNATTTAVERQRDKGSPLPFGDEG